MARLFIAVWPPEDLVADLMTLRRKDQRGVRFVPPENWHVSLRFLGESDPDAVEAALVGIELPAARARAGPAVDVLAERALVLPVGGLDDLAGVVSAHTRTLGEPPPKRRFRGHLTLARIRPDVAMPPALGAMVGGEFEVEEVALVRSRLDPDHARYDTLTTWPVG